MILLKLKQLIQNKQVDNQNLIESMLSGFKILRKKDHEQVIIYGAAAKDIVVQVFKEKNYTYAMKVSALFFPDYCLQSDIDNYALLNTLKSFQDLETYESEQLCELNNISVTEVFYLKNREQVIQFTSLLNFLMNCEYVEPFKKGTLYSSLVTPNQYMSAMEINRGEPGYLDTVLTGYSDRIVELLHN